MYVDVDNNYYAPSPSHYGVAFLGCIGTGAEIQVDNGGVYNMSTANLNQIRTVFDGNSNAYTECM